MIKIAFLNGWGEDDQQLLARYAKQTPNSRGVWGRLEGTLEWSQADFLVLLDRPSKALDITRLPLDRVIYLQREAHKDPWIGPFEAGNFYFYGDYTHCFHLVTWWLRHSWDDLVRMHKPKKMKLLSTVTSGNFHYLPEHRMRVAFLSRIAKAYPGIDVFGRGIGAFVTSDCYRGPLNQFGNCKAQGLIEYLYSISIENKVHVNYFTEKIADALLCWAKPLYWGDESILRYLDISSVSLLPQQLHTYTVSNLLRDISDEPDWTSIADSRERILFEYNIWPALEKIIDGQSPLPRCAPDLPSSTLSSASD